LAHEWLDPKRVADWLSVDQADEHVAIATAATAAYVERFREDVDFTAALGPELDDLVQACVELAALQYQQRNAPSGFPGYGEIGDGSFAAGYGGADVFRISQLYRRIGIRNARTA
jgi:hypothetical protein